MKKLMFLLLCLSAIAGILFLSSCGEQAETPETTVPSPVTVTFRVNGEAVTQVVEFGEVPVYNGNNTWEDDKEIVYSITGWDKAFTPAVKDTTYTAVVKSVPVQKVSVKWVTKTNTFETVVRAGEVPTPPEIAQTVSTVSTIYSFTNEWTPALSAVIEDTVYTAAYTETVREYKVEFKAGDNTVEVQSVPYMEEPVAPAVSIPEGYSTVYWGDLSKVKSDRVCTAVFSNTDPQTVGTALTALKEGTIKERAVAGLTLLLEDSRYTPAFVEQITTYLRWLIKGGNEPDFSFSPNFYQPMVAAALALAKENDAIWSCFTSAEIEKFDLLMKCMAVQSAQATDDNCNYLTGTDFSGNYKKTWNPNYPLSNVPQILFCVSYFGSGADVNQILKDFDYDEYIAKFTEYGWTNVLSVWGEEYDAEEQTITYLISDESKNSENNGKYLIGKIVADDGEGHLTLEIETSSEDVAADDYGELGLGFKVGDTRQISYTTPRAMMMQGGDVYVLKALYRNSQYCGKYGGTGVGVPGIGSVGYHYKGFSLDEVSSIWNALLKYNYSGGAVISAANFDTATNDYLCYITDRSSSPVEGLNGMMLEFNNSGRSSLSYTSVDFAMCVSVNAALEMLGLYDSESEDNLSVSNLVWIGNYDFLYKAEKGYVSYSGTAVRGKPVPVYGEGDTFELSAFLWNEFGADEFDLETMLNELNALVVKNPIIEASGSNSTNDMTSTPTGKTYANDTRKGKHYWENDLFISFSILYDDNMLNSFEVRMRSYGFNTAANREKILNYSLGTFTFVSAVPADVSYPTSFSFGEYGWHRLTFRFHQTAEAIQATQSVQYGMLLTIYLDGKLVGTYTEDVNRYVEKHWMLFSATYSETAENHLTYSDSGDNPTLQFYKNGVFNSPSNLWFMDYGDGVISCTDTVENVQPITYVLNGGRFEQNGTVTAEGGYQTSYAVSDVGYFISEGRTYLLPTPVKDGFVFAGWYTESELQNAVTDIQNNGSPVTVYAAWTPIQ